MIPVYHLLPPANRESMLGPSQVVPTGLTMRLCTSEIEQAGQGEVEVVPKAVGFSIRVRVRKAYC